MSPERRAEIVDLLEQSRQAFHEAAEAVHAELAHRRLAEDAWSPLDIAEHVVLAENGMFRILGMAKPDETAAENREKEAALGKMIVNRAKPVPSPDRVKPAGRFPTLADALAQFDEARQRTIVFARETEHDLFGITAQHPFFGAVNGYELLIIMAGHARRHAAQIAETVTL